MTPDDRATISHAANLLEGEAAALKDGHVVAGTDRWDDADGDPATAAAKLGYDELVAVATNLRRIIA